MERREDTGSSGQRRAMPAGSPAAARVRPLEQPLQISAPQAPRGPTREEPGCSQTSDPPHANSVQTSPQDPRVTSRGPGRVPVLSSAQGESQRPSLGPAPALHCEPRKKASAAQSKQFTETLWGTPAGGA